ncbi:fumarate reductase [Peptococcaceae bacterium SCADC1_2_3]|jgi:fumarate reductase iron-sulfur subunit|nr:fumarate reductase [Peptococcaceae bacterium SCADC1_2_3]KFI36723.1 fumarate reductase [Peptococcaceae bacterium SCADC1_2_3]KFI38180.1 fumarate reductase [Peptococcaceae bacterium SCADC1_2_3]
MARELIFNIFRFNPNTPDIRPYIQTYRLQEEPQMNLFIALTRIREEQDPTLIFDFCCRAGICGSCGMIVNGKPKLACRTPVSDLKRKITLYPLPVFKLIGDLSVDTGIWFRECNLRTESWIHTNKAFNENELEERMDNKTALNIYEADRCIECGCCIATCITMNIREDFLGAAGINKISRFMLDPRDNRTDHQYYEIVGSDDGVFGCTALMACDSYCPQQIPLQKQLAYVRRKLLIAGLRAG